MLDKLRHLKALILMDDVSSPNHMYRAFDDYVSAYMVDFNYIASCGDYYDQVFVQLHQLQVLGIVLTYEYRE